MTDYVDRHLQPLEALLSEFTNAVFEAQPDNPEEFLLQTLQKRLGKRAAGSSRSESHEQQPFQVLAWSAGTRHAGTLAALETLAALDTKPPAMHFQALQDAFLSDVALAAAVDDWESGMTDTMWLDEAKRVPVPGALPFNGKAVFQMFLENVGNGSALQEQFATILYQDEECIAFTPAGFQGQQAEGSAKDEQVLEAFHTDSAAHDGADKAKAKAVAKLAQTAVDHLTRTPLTMNPTSFNHGGNSALMSHAHVLVIPRRRIYNAVTLRESDAPLVRHMEQVSGF